MNGDKESSTKKGSSKKTCSKESSTKKGSSKKTCSKESSKKIAAR